MRLIILNLLVLFCFSCFSQQNEFLLKGQITTSNNNPIPDAHVINYRNLNKVVSDKNGKFNVLVEKGDSLMISHVVFFRKKVYVDSVRAYPVITLIVDTINIVEIHVSPNQKTDYQKAMDNIASIKTAKILPYEKIKQDEQNPVNAIVTEHNKLARTEASSVTLIRFSPGFLIGKIIDKRKRCKKSKEFKSTRKLKQKQESN